MNFNWKEGGRWDAFVATLFSILMLAHSTQNQTRQWLQLVLSMQRYLWENSNSKNLWFSSPSNTNSCAFFHPPLIPIYIFSQFDFLHAVHHSDKHLSGISKVDAVGRQFRFWFACLGENVCRFAENVKSTMSFPSNFIRWMAWILLFEHTLYTYATALIHGQMFGFMS